MCRHLDSAEELIRRLAAFGLDYVRGEKAMGTLVNGGDVPPPSIRRAMPVSRLHREQQREAPRDHATADDDQDGGKSLSQLRSLS